MEYDNILKKLKSWLMSKRSAKPVTITLSFERPRKVMAVKKES